jgi:hypothetical protein
MQVSSLVSNPWSSCKVSSILLLHYENLQIFMSDVGYRTKVYSDIRYNVGLCALQSDIGCSDIRLSPISLITDIGLSDHLWQNMIVLAKLKGSLLHVLLIVTIADQ